LPVTCLPLSSYTLALILASLPPSLLCAAHVRAAVIAPHFQVFSRACPPSSHLGFAGFIWKGFPSTQDWIRVPSCVLM
jgi:hypothetical protein